jgi:hypothetical protein
MRQYCSCLLRNELFISLDSAGRQNLEIIVFFNLSHSECLKGPSHKIFYLKRFFSSNNSICAPDQRAKAFLYMASYLQRYSVMKSAFLVASGVNGIADYKSDSLLTPIFLCKFCGCSEVHFVYV